MILPEYINIFLLSSYVHNICLLDGNFASGDIQ